jgi:hypothetical protein
MAMGKGGAGGQRTRNLRLNNAGISLSNADGLANRGFMQAWSSMEQQGAACKIISAIKSSA